LPRGPGSWEMRRIPDRRVEKSVYRNFIEISSHCPTGQWKSVVAALINARSRFDEIPTKRFPDGLVDIRSAAGELTWRDERMAILSDRNLVFVVDDDPGTLRGMKRLLREYGYASVLFPSVEAFENCDDFDAAFCLILDIDLNKESGIELRHRLKADGVSLPVIYITANDNPATRMAALASGCIAYLTKPFAASSLLEPVEKAAAGLA
jgi:CheY-like chemotaxis protein